MTTNVNCKTAHQNLDQLRLCCNKAEFQRLLSFSEHLGIDDSDHFKFSSTGHSGTSQSECGNKRSSSKVLILLYFSPTDDNLESTHSHSFLMEKGGYSDRRAFLKDQRVELRITEERLLAKWLLKFLFHSSMPPTMPWGLSCDLL